MVFGICAFYLSSLKLIFTHRSQLLHPQIFITKPHKWLNGLWLNVAAFRGVINALWPKPDKTAQ